MGDDARVILALARMGQHRQAVVEAGAGSDDLNLAGPPTWSRPAWDAFRAKYGRYPYTASELPPTFAGAPGWVYELMNLRQPPVTVQP